MLDINKIYNEDNLKIMARMPSEYVDLVVTSPPYDERRTYTGYSFDFESTANELYRVIKPGGLYRIQVTEQTKRERVSNKHCFLRSAVSICLIR